MANFKERMQLLRAVKQHSIIRTANNQDFANLLAEFENMVSLLSQDHYKIKDLEIQVEKLVEEKEWYAQDNDRLRESNSGMESRLTIYNNIINDILSVADKNGLIREFEEHKKAQLDLLFDYELRSSS